MGNMSLNRWTTDRNTTENREKIITSTKEQHTTITEIDGNDSIETDMMESRQLSGETEKITFVPETPEVLRRSTRERRKQARYREL